MTVNIVDEGAEPLSVHCHRHILLLKPAFFLEKVANLARALVNSI